MLTIAGAEMKNYLDQYPPSYLIDGNLNNFAHSRTYDEDGMWIRINLKQCSIITKVIVYNRKSNIDRIVGASVFIKTGEEYVKDCGKINSAKDSYTFNCEGDGNVIEISQEGEVGRWNIAEIEVYGIPEKSPCPGLDL